MIVLACVRANLPMVEEKLRARGMDPAEVLGDFEAVDRERRSAITRKEQALAKRKEISARFGRAKQTGPDRADLLDAAQELARQAESEIAMIPELEAVAASADARLRDILETLPNLPQGDVPVGQSEHDNIEL